MSLEETIKENTAAILKLVEVTTGLATLRTEAIENVKAAAASPKAAAKVKEVAATAVAEEKPEPAPVEDPVHGELTKKIAGYLTSTDREDERAARKAKIISLLNHEQIKRADVAADAAPDTKNIKPEAMQMFKDNLDNLIARGDLTQPASASLV